MAFESVNMSTYGTSSVEIYKAKADEMRAAANVVGWMETRQILLRLAAAYDAVADRVARRALSADVAVS